MQEDGHLEWASFWAFFAAGFVYLRKAVRPPFRLTDGWFLLALAAFCAFVALEEISWGQRIIGYRPPAYFLGANYQQELNIHNIVDTDLRKLALRALIFGYGVLLPLAMLPRAAGERLRRAAIVAPPAAMVPAFLVTGIGQISYPVRFTGEWVELMLGLCFLFSAMSLRRRCASDQPAPTPLTARRFATAWLAIVVAGVASAAATRYQRDDQPARLRSANLELRALQRDMLANRRATRCGPHKRLYTYAMQYGADYLFNGEFAQLQKRGLPELRAEYLLDPWNNAYWLRDNCATGERGRTTYLYSFGPNRRRDSTKWQIGGDDIAVYLRGAAQ